MALFLRGFSGLARPLALCFMIALEIALLQQPAAAIDILIKYDYDSTNFFLNDTQKRAAVEAAARRYSDIITTSLSAVTLANDSLDQRIAFTHPGTGNSFQISPPPGPNTDIAVAVNGASAAANEYRGPWSIPADQVIIYVGGRSLTPNGVTSTGGQSSGLNVGAVYTSPTSVANRGFRQS